MSFSNNSCAGRKPKVKTPGDPKPAAVLNAFKMGTWGQAGKPAPEETKTTPQRARRSKPKSAKRAKPVTNREGGAKAKPRIRAAKPPTKVSVKGRKTEAQRKAMAHEDKHVNSPRSPEPTQSKPRSAGASDATPKKANPSARLTRISRADRDVTQPPVSAGAGAVEMRAAPGSSIDNEDFQSWITRVRVLNQNDAAPRDEPETGKTDTGGPSGAESTMDPSATAQPIASTPPVKPVQNSRDWSQTAKKALDEMLVTLPEDQPAGWSASYPRQSPVPPPPSGMEISS